MYKIDSSLKEFVESGVAAVVGTGSAAGRPEVAYGWAPRVRDDGVTVEVFLDTARAGKALANLHENPRIAMTLADPVSYRSVQLKGTFVETLQPTEVDHTWVQDRREAFLTVTSLIGDPPQTIRNLWLDDIIGVAFTLDSAFDQTPGQDAGKPL